MKKILLLLLFSIWCSFLNAAPFRYLPCSITQPNGEVIECFASGDEFFNWLHDQDGYTIIQAPDGYYYYATKQDGKLIPSVNLVNKINPEAIGLQKWTKISKTEYQKRVLSFQVPNALKSSGPNNAPHKGTLNNLVIYIRFLGDDEFITFRNTYDDKLNLSTGVSLKTYFDEVSYNQLTISSTHYPICATPSSSNASYEDSHARGYFQAYNATANSIGYSSDDEKRSREHQLLADAVDWINANSPIDAGLDIDADGNGDVDNVCFMIKGNSGGWNDLLWAHRWVLYSQTISINGKRVYDYTFQPENQVTVSTLCHEMFHALGAPDLYHYDEAIFAPVGPWDIMESGTGHMGAYMKWKYAEGAWIASIPEITASGTYTLNPLTSSTNNCFKIASPNSTSEYFVLEYRKKEGNFESNIPGSGLLVYRINTNFEGNANFDNSSVFDEVYIYRPGGTNLINGNVTNANFTADVNRTALNDGTNPKSFLHNGLPGGLDISNVTAVGNTISFDVYISDVKAPQNFVATTASETQIDLSWNLNTDNNDVLIAYSLTDLIGSPIKGASYVIGNQIPGGGIVAFAGNSTSYSHSALTVGTNYFYRIWSKNGVNVYSSGIPVSGSTACSAPVIPIVQGFNDDNISPCWTVEVVAVGKLERDPPAITQLKSSAYPDATPNEGSYMIKFNSMDCGVGNVMRLSSPWFSTVGQNELIASFAWHRDKETTELDKMTFQWSIDGTNWIDGPSYQRYHNVNGWTKQSFSLPSELLGLDKLKIGFQFTSEFGYNCYLDKFRIGPTSTSIGAELGMSEFLIYPNPSKGLFQLISTKNYNKMNIEVRDISGKMVHYKSYRKSADITIDLTGHPKGIYLLTIHADKKIINQKLILE